MDDSKGQTPGEMPPEKPSPAVFGELEAQGFFRQIQEIEASLKNIAEELANFARSATERAQETESFAAHILALQALAAVLARHIGVPPETLAAEVKDEIRARTAKLAGNADGSPEVLAVAQAVLGEKR